MTADLTASARDVTGDAPRSVSELFADVPYEEKGTLQSGFSTRQTGPESYEIAVDGAAATPVARLVAIGFARAAEIGLEHSWKNLRVVEIKRTAHCNPARQEHAPEAAITGGSPRLVLQVVYGPSATGPEVRDSAETFAEMRGRLAQMTTSEAEKEAIVEWVFQYCASTGMDESASESGGAAAR